jgi:hypothetical protein
MNLTFFGERIFLVGERILFVRESPITLPDARRDFPLLFITSAKNRITFFHFKYKKGTIPNLSTNKQRCT